MIFKKNEKKNKKVERIIEVFYIYNYENIVNQNVVKKKKIWNMRWICNEQNCHIERILTELIVFISRISWKI